MPTPWITTRTSTSVAAMTINGSVKPVERDTSRSTFDRPIRISRDLPTLAAEVDRCRWHPPNHYHQRHDTDLTNEVTSVGHLNIGIEIQSKQNIIDSTQQPGQSRFNYLHLSS